MIYKKNIIAMSLTTFSMLSSFSLLQWFANPNMQAAGVLFVFGLAMGSFLNVLVYRLPLMLEQAWLAECAEVAGTSAGTQPALTLSAPSSHCPACGHTLRAWELIPVASFLWLRGRCAACHAKISFRYPAVELACGAGFALVGWFTGFHALAIAQLAFLYILMALTLIDLDTQLLPDVLTQLLLWLGLSANLFGLFVPLADAVVGAMAGYVAMWGIAAAFRACTGMDGLGQGDFKLVAAMSAWLGWTALPMIIMFGATASAIVGVSLISLRKVDRGTPQPFGPYLILAGGTAWLWGPQIISWYLGFL
ncbi:A24 family peptidase [Vogesella sp. XCS3]|uniref:prepilin peptidase n=1 Tax=Vogesella sp. XCS3 TaxID=2877939 RepID=UPI00351CC875